MIFVQMMFTCFAANSVHDIDIFLICGEIGENWRDLGTVLELDSAALDIIAASRENCRELARKVLQKWKQKEGSGATVGILIDALEKMERRDVVEKLLGM